MLVKIVVTVVTFVTVTAAGGFAAVTTMTRTHVEARAANNGYTKDQCKHGGWKQLGYKNQGQCVSHFAKDGHGHDDHQGDKHDDHHDDKNHHGDHDKHDQGGHRG